MSVEKTTGIEYTVVRTPRKTIGIKINEKGEVEVRAARYVPAAEIERAIIDNRMFIRSAVERQKAASRERDSFCVTFGSKLLYLGREYELKQGNENRIGFDGNAFYAPGILPLETIKRGIVMLYRKLAEQYLHTHVPDLAKQMKVTPTAVKVNSAKTRWGSCSGKNSLNFSWRLIMADEETVKYVIIHELSHIKEHNHSERFWKTVERYCPNYREAERKLKLLSERLSKENWE